jgi:phosphoserine phosphatase RsbU/P
MDSSEKSLPSKHSAGDKRKGRGIAFRLSFLILLTTSAIFLAVVGYYYVFSRQMIAKKIEENATYLAQARANRIDRVLAAVEKIPSDLAAIMEHLPPNAEQREALMDSVLRNNPEIYGSALAFEPYAYRADLRRYAPYWYRENNRIHSTEITYDYFTWDWYQIARELERGAWVEPYFDEGGGNTLMSTYARPFYRWEGSQRRLQGIATVDVSLLWLKDIVSSIRIGETGYAFLVSHNGTFVTHPNPALIMNESIFSVAEERNDPHLRAIGRDMIAGKSGFIPTMDMLSGARGWMAYAPLPSSGWSLAVLFPQHEVMADISQLNRRVLLLGTGGFILLYGIITWIARGITRPLRELTAAATDISEGNLDTPIPPVRTRDEVGTLAASFHFMRDSLKEHISNLTETTAAKERIESELRLAHDIQMGILPHTFPAFPDRKEFDIYANIVPAREVGGDLYDYFLIDNTRLCFAIGDVSGKGVPASLFMAITKMLIKAKTDTLLGPGEILERVNEVLSEDNPSMMFVTLFLGIFDVATGSLAYSNGGHNPPYIIRADGTVAQLEGTKGIALGAVEGLSFQSKEITLKKGDKLFLYTDGVSEAANPRDELYSEGRLENDLSDLKHESLADMIGCILGRVEAFSAEAPQADDITMMALEFYTAEN